MRKLFILTIVLTPLILCQNICEEQFRTAQNLYNSGKYFDAVTEFKRLIFFDTANTYRADAEYYIGISYKKGGFYNEALQYLGLSRMHNSEAGLSYKISIEIIKCNILRRTTNHALQEITTLELIAKDSLQKKEMDVLKGFAYSFSSNWDLAAKYFRKAGFSGLANLCERTSDDMYSETKANILSIILPGAGQIYTGNYLNGIISLGLNALTLYLTINAFTEDRIFDGIITGNFLWYRFYTGNISNAVKFARENNHQTEYKALLKLQNSDEYRLD